LVIGIDASRAATGRRTGTEAYAYHLIRALIPLAADAGHALRLYFRGPPPPDLVETDRGVDIVVRPFPRLWTHLALGRELARRPVSVFFTPAHVIPLGYRGRSVATVHDLGFHYFPAAHSRGQRAYLQWSTRHNVRRAGAVVADSRATRDDLVALYHCPPERIEVVYPGVDPDLRPVSDGARLAEVRGRYGLAAPYLLYLGTLQPRKNLVRLVQAYVASGLPHQLVLAGRPGWLARPILAEIERLPEALRQRVVVPGYVTEADKAAVLSGATALVFPSLYEGFGFPVLEAQACAVPVMCANTSSLPEVAGEGALLVDPLDTLGMAAALVEITADARLRERLIAAGQRNYLRFSWHEAAVKVLSVLVRAGN
jgi:glycosyltransferase involved in cell wall biosynthesis